MANSNHHSPVKKELEFVDEIDENGNSIGRVEKMDAHLRGIRHAAVHVFVFTSKHELVLQYRSHRKRIYPLKWDTSVGGHVHAGESLDAGVKREMGEELGLHVQPRHLGWADVSDHEGEYHHRERVHYYWVVLPVHTALVPNEEFDDIAFITLEKMPAFISTNNFTATFLAGWKKFSNQLQRVIHAKKINEVK